MVSFQPAPTVNATEPLQDYEVSLLNATEPVKYLNNIVEADHGKLKRLINPVRGFKTMKTAYATIKRFEIMRMFKKGQMNAWTRGQGLLGEICLIERQFYTYTA